MDENLLENRIQCVDDEVVDDAVSEISRENLTLHGAVDNEGNAFPDRIRSIHNLLMKRDKIRLVIKLKLNCAGGVPFVFSAVVVGEEELCEVHYLGW